MDHHGRAVLIHEEIAVHPVGERDNSRVSIICDVQRREIAGVLGVARFAVVTLQVPARREERAALTDQLAADWLRPEENA